jgi:hypothetical protein
MKIKFYLFLILLIVFVNGCNKETAADTSQITANVVEIEETEEIPEAATEEENITTVRLCHDTDNGIVRWEEGSIFGFYNNATRFEFEDYCQNFNYLMEFYCDEENPKQRLFLCRNGCEENHCL